MKLWQENALMTSSRIKVSSIESWFFLNWKTYLTIKSKFPLSISFIRHSPSAASCLVSLLAWSWHLISPNLFFQKFRRSIENPFTPFQFFPASLMSSGRVSRLRQCVKITFPQRRIHTAAKGTYTSSRGPCLRYALERGSGSFSKAARKSWME